MTNDTGRRKTEPVTSEERDGDRGREDTHPAFGVAVVNRSSGTSRTLFQSDLRHRDTIHLSIRRAERIRDLNRDWVHPRDELIEVEMSLAQWGALVSSIGIGSGVPVTLRRTEQDVRVPEIPFEPRIAASVAETRGAVARLLARARESFEAVTDAVEGRRGVKAIRDALRTHQSVLNNAESNAAFAVTSLAEAAEDVTSQAKADIEAHILSAMALTGAPASIEAPPLDLYEIEARPFGLGNE